MWKQKASRLLAVLLAVLLLSQAAAFQTLAFAAEDSATPVLQDGTAVIPKGADLATVKAALYDALVVNKDEVNADDLKWEYECEGKTKIMGIDSWGNRSFGSIEGFSTTAGTLKTYTYEHPPLAENAYDTYQIRANGSNTVTLNKVEKLSSSITLKENASVNLAYTDATTVDYDAVRQQIWDNVVDATEPELTLSDVTIEYYATATSGAVGSLGKNYAPLQGGQVEGLTYPAMTEGTQKIKVSWGGNETYFDTSAEVDINVLGRQTAQFNLKEGPYTVGLVYNQDLTYNTAAVNQAIFDAVIKSTEPELGLADVNIDYKLELGAQNVTISWGGNAQYAGNSVTVSVTFTDERTQSDISFVENPSVKLVYNEDLTVDYDAVRSAIWSDVVASTTPSDLTLDDVTIEYYATATTGNLGSIGKNYAPLQGGQVDKLTYPAMGEGTQTIRISYPGTDVYTGFSKEVSVTVLGRPEVVFEKNAATGEDGSYEVGMVFDADQNYDYAAVEQAIFNAVVASSEPEMGLEDVTIEYNADPTSTIDVWAPLDKGGLNPFGLGTWEIRFSWAETPEYKGGSFEVKVTVSDNRIASTIVYKEGATITYNMDPEVMKQDLFENAIDWSASTLPADASIDDFTFEYYATAESGTIGNLGQNWAPIEGGTVSLLTYPQMGAGENQQVRISYKGNAEYRPVQDVEGTVTVNKATVKVTVHSTSKYPEEPVPEGFVTTDPADKFDIYTIYAGITSNVTTHVYLQLPDSFTTDSTAYKFIDAIYKASHDGTSLSDVLQEGMTVGELRALLTEVIDKVQEMDPNGTMAGVVSNIVGFDVEGLITLLDVLNKLPSIVDNVHVSIGVPNKAGLYTVYAIASNKNYETGVGMGMLTVKMRVIGAKLEWNQEIKKITVEEAATADFGAHVTYNGEPVVSDNVHYLYTGVTSTLKPYTSTTTPPTEPGRYTVTVVTLGGSYLTAPLTRSFQITK